MSGQERDASRATHVKRNQGATTDYQFNKHVIHRLFCKRCGIASYATGKKPDGTQIYSVKVRCLDDVQVGKLDVDHVDGKSR